MSSESRDFQELLGTLFDGTMGKMESSVPSTKQPTKYKKGESIIEKKLLELVEQGVYRSKSPIPKSMASSFHRGSEQESVQQEEREQRSILDEVEPFDYSWYKEKVVNDERIRMKERELQIQNSILDSKSIYELLDTVYNEINQASYPTYYHKIIKTAIEYASKRDPYLALSIFEQTKAKSIQSYINGCTVETYNSILQLRWDAWKDVHGMLDLLEEMAINGIKVNGETRQVVRKAVTEIEEEEQVDYADKQGVYWNMDERRTCNIMKEMANKWLLKK